MNEKTLNSEYHVPVMTHEVMEQFEIEPGAIVVDATFGGGGHSKLFALAGAVVHAIDMDADAITAAESWLPEYPAISLYKGSFEHLAAIAAEHDIHEASAILFDLGVSSHQLDTGSRGFSFQYDAPLDMRMDQSLSVMAKDLVAGLGEKELTMLFEKYGEEHNARKIARAIVEQRKQQPIVTTKQLADLIQGIVRSHDRIHPSTRVFQALRIAVNSELVGLEAALPQAFDLLKHGGKLGVISFHSLEDRIVKQQFQQWENAELGESTKKPIIAAEEEVSKNPRARSAKLRVFTKN